jgi:Endosomal/lysosomal potassium channel TMEM175
MHLPDRFRQGELRLTRIEAFSDGVFAIVVTLLVLELKVPALKDHASVSELAHALVDLLPKFLSPARAGAPRQLRHGVVELDFFDGSILHSVPLQAQRNRAET